MALWVGLGWDLSLNMDRLRAQAGPVREPRGSRSGTPQAFLMSRHFSRDWLGWDGLDWDGMGWDGLGWDGLGWG